MKDPAHPPVDLLADHHEGLVTAAQAVAVAAHLDTCAECRSLVAALDEVAEVLAAEGSRTPAMPASVASSLEQ
ncbi:MAG: zf-HC2 domain-containing protein, partial [Actinomycetota bacterium]|nr:zf-HC2 domain-containing protein [Actinomycetota bacterium]